MFYAYRNPYGGGIEHRGSLSDAKRVAQELADSCGWTIELWQVLEVIKPQPDRRIEYAHFGLMRDPKTDTIHADPFRD